MSRISERREQVEAAMLREGEGLAVGALARALDVSRWTVQRDMKAVRARWAALSRAVGEDLLAEKTRTAMLFEAVAMRALARYAQLEAAGSEGTAAVGYLNAALRALEARARLMGLERVKPRSRWRY